MNKLYFILLMILISRVYSMEKKWEISSFADFKKRYTVLTYPEMYHKLKIKDHDVDKIYEENIKETYANGNPIVSLNELLRAIEFAGAKIGNVVCSASWATGNPLSQNFFSIDSVPEGKIDLTKPEHIALFAAYEKKLLLDDSKGEQAVFFGDLHGGCKSLIKSLEDYIDEKSFKLKATKKSIHLVFCGDFVDSGKDGVEVLYVLARIAGENPNNVHLVRGNHEDSKFNMKQLFYQELAYKYGLIKPDSDFFFGKYSLGSKEYNKITRFYDFMPVALFVGNRRNIFAGYDWRIACHGGFEVGDADIQRLLSCPGKVAFKVVGESIDNHPYRSIICRKSVWEEIKKKHDLKIEDHARQDFNDTLQDFVPVSPGSGIPVVDNQIQESKLDDRVTLGYCWSLFNEKNDSDLSYVSKLNAWCFGEKLTNILFKRSSSWRHRLVGMVRAHQHVSKSADYTNLPLMENMFKNKGVWSLWQSIRSQNPGRYGAVTTLMVAPDTVYGIPMRAQKDEEKHYPGVVKYSSLRLIPKRKGWFGVDVETKVKEVDGILPKEYQTEHKALMQENEQKNKNKRQPESNFKSKKYTQSQKAGWCSII